MAELLSVAEAIKRVASHAAPLAPCPLPLADSLGLVLAEDVASDIDSPPHDKAMMDGFAVRSEDGAGQDGLAERRIIESVFAGDVPTLPVGAGEATRIMTGAPMPAGADAVVPVEKTEAAGGIVRLLDVPIAGKHVMPRGEAMRAGDVVLRAGATIHAAQVGLLAEVGRASVPVAPWPRVAVLPTGAELVAADQAPGPGQIRNSNGPMLLAAVREAGGEPIDAGLATDDEQALRAAILAARGADVLLISGGVSAGDRDLAPGVLAELGVEKVFHKVAVKPGKPIWFGVWPREPTMASRERQRPEQNPTYVFGLPGNPVSSFVCFQLFVRPLLGVLAGRGFWGLEAIETPLAADLSHPGGRETYLPARWREAKLELVRWRGSGDLVGLSAAEALVRLPPEPAELRAGDPVKALILPGGDRVDRPKTS